FRRRNAGLTCSVAPIFDATGGLIAVLDVSSMGPTDRQAEALALDRVDQAARRIGLFQFGRSFRDAWLVRLTDAPGTLNAGEEML
ncbi:hypothetical protein ACKI2E_43795, partial [Streptomyces galilaeus]